jgi:hypothetical protein
MPLPLTYQSTFTTSLSADEIAARMTEHNNQMHGVQFAWSFQFYGTVDRAGFFLRKRIRGRNVGFPSVQGKIIGDNPTRLSVTITPGYVKFFFMLAFILVFFIVVLSTDQMDVNGQMRVFDFEKRLQIGGGISLALLVYLYFDSLFPVGRARRWLIKHLELRS